MVSVNGEIRAVSLRLREALSGSLETAELLWVEDGMAAVSLDGETCLLRKGEGLFCPAGCHRTVQAMQEAQAVLVSFSADLGPIWNRIFPINPFYPAALVMEFENQQADHDRMMALLLEQVLILCTRQGGTAMARQTASVISDPHAVIVFQVLSYLHEHFDRRITLDLLAGMHDISVTQLKRIFKEQTGTTIITYLTDLRMEQAKVLIRQGDMSFTRIAEAVGYENIYYFSTQFKKQTGMTPTEYSRSQTP